MKLFELYKHPDDTVEVRCIMPVSRQESKFRSQSLLYTSDREMWIRVQFSMYLVAALLEIEKKMPLQIIRDNMRVYINWLSDCIGLRRKHSFYTQMNQLSAMLNTIIASTDCDEQLEEIETLAQQFKLHWENSVEFPLQYTPVTDMQQKAA